MLAEQADWTDRMAAMSGMVEPPRARERLEEALCFDDTPAVEETNVVELAAFIARVNRSL